MEQYRIIKFLKVDGYERFAKIQMLGNENKNYKVHFSENDEYLEEKQISQKRKPGDVIGGNIYIDLAFCAKKADSDIMFSQNINNSVRVDAIVEVSRIEDEYTIYAKTNIIDDEILVEFERKVDCEIGDRILLDGSLELEIEE